MAAPSSAPRGERPGTPGATWDTQLVWGGERVVPDGEPEPRANRRARRAARRGGPPCGNNPHFELTDGDRAAIEEFRAYLADRATETDR